MPIAKFDCPSISKLDGDKRNTEGDKDLLPRAYILNFESRCPARGWEYLVTLQLIDIMFK